MTASLPQRPSLGRGLFYTRDSGHRRARRY